MPDERAEAGLPSRVRSNAAIASRVDGRIKSGHDGKGWAFGSISVTAGLDPAVHRATRAVSNARTGQPWVKPGHDGWRRIVASLAISFAFFALPVRAEISAEDRATARQAEEYLNSVRSLTAGFVQIGPNGEVAKGKIFLRRPGKLRFEYDPPSPLLLVADGRWLVLEDRELKHVDRWPVGETPLAVLVADRVDLDGSVEVTKVKREGGVLRVAIVDRKRRDEGHLTLIFNETPMELRQWEVHDAQGGVTHVSLHDPQVNLQLADALFFYDHFGKFPGDQGR